MVDGPPELGKRLLPVGRVRGKAVPVRGFVCRRNVSPRPRLHAYHAHSIIPHTMKSITRTASFAILTACAVTAMVALAADEKKPAPAVSEEEMMKAWAAAATPGPAHKVLDGYAGEWTVHTKLWMKPDAPVMESDGTASGKWLLGKRYIDVTMKGTMMGQPFEGRGTYGYNNMRKTYECAWLDNMGTAMTLTTGTASTDGKTLTYEGKMDDPMSGAKDKVFKFIERFVSKDEILSEMHDPALGEKSKMMEIVYKRKK